MNPSSPLARSKRIERGGGQSLTMVDDIVNLDELLNFSLPPRNSISQSVPRRSRRNASSQYGWNKEKFLNAQYRFVMRPTGDYVVHFADPDIFFQWQDIVQVIIPRNPVLYPTEHTSLNALGENTFNCPICLSPPVAPRITKCGHIFCFPCFLHYLSTTDNKWARCPICFDSITESQLKFVKWFDYQPTKELPENSGDVLGSVSDRGALLSMRLMSRPQMTNLALPHSTTWPSEAIPPLRAPFFFLPDVPTFARFMLATAEHLRADFQRDIKELASERAVVEGMNDTVGLSFIDAARTRVLQQITATSDLDTLTIRRELQNVLNTLSTLTTHGMGVRDQDAPTPSSISSGDVTCGFSKARGYSQWMTPVNGESQRVPKPRRRKVNPPPPTASTYYFYQAATGRPIFLHPLDIRILLSKFSSYALFPPDITIHVESYTESSVNDDLRRRCKYLAHLPESADVIFVEADLENVVGRETLRAFEGALRMRRSKREEKAQKEERAKIRAEELQRVHERKAGLWRDTDRLTTTESRFVDTEGLTYSSPVVPSSAASAWGERSFASAAYAATSNSAWRAESHVPLRNMDHETEIDVAWLEMEQRHGSRKKGRNKLVVLGGIGGRRR